MQVFGGATVRFSSEITGLSVVHAANGRELGRVSEWLLDRDGEAIVAFVAEGGGWLPQKKIFAFRDILGLGNGAVIVAREGLAPHGEHPAVDGHPTNRVLGKRMLTKSGDELGVVEDILFDEGTGKIAGWRLSSGLIDDILSGRSVMEQQPLLSIGEDALIIDFRKE